MKGCARSSCNPLKNKCRIDVKRCGKFSNFQSDCCRTSRGKFDLFFAYPCQSLFVPTWPLLVACVSSSHRAVLTSGTIIVCLLPLTAGAIAVSFLFFQVNLNLSVAEKLDLPNNTKCTSAQPIKLNKQVLYSKNTARDVSKFRCYGRDIIMV